MKLNLFYLLLFKSILNEVKLQVLSELSFMR
jgi:hypothetical protein